MLGALALSSGFFFTFSNCLRSIIFPVNFGPFNFLYCVFIVSNTSDVSDVSDVSKEASSLALAADFSFSTFTDSSFSSCITSCFSSKTFLEGTSVTFFSTFGASSGFFSSTLVAGFSSLTVTFGVSTEIGAGFATAFLGAISILPTVFICNFSDLAFKTSSFFSASSLFLSIFASSSILIASFSFLFSSPTSFDAAFLLASVWKPS